MSAGAAATLTAREYATRAFRDAANSARTGLMLVLVRWALEIDGTDTDMIARVIRGLIGAGALLVGS